MKWKTVKSKIFKQTPWTTFVQNEFEMPNGKRGTYYFVKSNGSSMVVPVTAEGKIVLIRQYRYLIDAESVEFPGGGVKEGQSFEETARVELKEETGYAAEKFEYVGEFVPWNGVTDEKCKVFVATGLQEGEMALEEAEEGVRIVLITIGEMEEMIKNNIIKDGQTLASWMLAKNRINL